MGKQLEAFVEVTPPAAVSLTPDYRQFIEVTPPNDLLTIRAWRGRLQPFESDETARDFLAAAEADRQVFVSEGRLLVDKAKRPSALDPLLVNMALACEVLICELKDSMPRAYLLSPRLPEHYILPGIYPHPRGDQTIDYGSARIPGLCVFSSAETIFDPDIDANTQFLDLLSQFLGKHLIWLRTRRLLRAVGGRTIVLYQPRPGEFIVDSTPRSQVIQTPRGLETICDYWKGHWPGPQAKATTPLKHLQQIALDQRCWCGFARSYKNCCRTKDLSAVSIAEQKRYTLK